MSFFEELKRRNVIRVAIAYGVAAWFILQLSDVVLENISAPDWVMQTIMLALVIGLPVVMLFAWVFEMTPEGIKKEKDVDRTQSITNVTGRKLDRMIIGVLTVLVAYLLIDKLVLQDEVIPPAGETKVAEAAPAIDESPSVAVLPFVNMSNDKENEYFSDGLTETLLHMLAQLPELRVAARTSSFAFKGQNISVGEIAKTLGVAHILEGSVQKSGDRVRITAQLIRANDGFHLWSQNYTRPLEDIFAIQDEIAGDVAQALDASLLGNASPDLKGIETSNLAAYDEYLKGLEQQAIYSYGSLNIAEDHFKQALVMDTTFMDARLALIRNHILKNGTGVIDKQELNELTTPLIVQVRQTDPDSRQARAFELYMKLTSEDLSLGEEGIASITTELRNMLPLIPGETLIRRAVARVLNDFFDKEMDAVEVVQAGLLIDPMEPQLHMSLGDIHQDHDRLDEALVSFQRAQELQPENPNIYGELAGLERDSNNLPAALRWMRMATEIDPRDHELAAGIANTLYELQLPEEGDRWAARVQALVPGSAMARTVELNRLKARNELEAALALSRSMVTEQIDMRAGFGGVLFDYTNLMMKENRTKEAWDLLVSIDPEIAEYDSLPDSLQSGFMQFTSAMLLGEFESFEVRKQAWQKIAGNLDAMGFRWRDPGSGNVLIDLVMLGETETAIEYYLNERLTKPMATNLGRHKQQFSQFYQGVFSDPRVVVRHAELEREYVQLQNEVREMLLEPEWNQ